MARELGVLVHRWTALVLCLFLVVVGLTGAVLLFYREPDNNPGAGAVDRAVGAIPWSVWWRLRGL